MKCIIKIERWNRIYLFTLRITQYWIQIWYISIRKLQCIEIARIFSTFYIKLIVTRRFFIYTQYAREKGHSCRFFIVFFSTESKCFDPFNIRHAFAIGYGLRRASMALEGNAEKNVDVFDWKNSITRGCIRQLQQPPVCNLCAMIFFHSESYSFFRDPITISQI